MERFIAATERQAIATEAVVRTNQGIHNQLRAFAEDSRLSLTMRIAQDSREGGPGVPTDEAMRRGVDERVRMQVELEMGEEDANGSEDGDSVAGSVHGEGSESSDGPDYVPSGEESESE